MRPASSDFAETPRGGSSTTPATDLRLSWKTSLTGALSDITSSTIVGRNADEKHAPFRASATATWLLLLPRDQDQNSSSVCWSPWNCRKTVAFLSLTVHAWTCGEDHSRPLRRALSVTAVVMRSRWSVFASPSQKAPSGPTTMFPGEEPGLGNGNGRGHQHFIGRFSHFGGLSAQWTINRQTADWGTASLRTTLRRAGGAGHWPTSLQKLNRQPPPME
jgi:hypothetical protein